MTPTPTEEDARSGRRQPQIWNTSVPAVARALAPVEATVALYPKERPYDLGLIGFGQGLAGQMTPFQMALVAATIGNLEGKTMKPKIEYDRPPEVFAQSTTPERAAEMRRIMGLVTAGPSGTATSVFVPIHAQGIITGGKTGTAEKQIPLYDPKTGEEKKVLKIERDRRGNPIRERWETVLDPEFRIDSWFLCIAPLDRPQLAIAVIIEGGGYGAKAAAPVAAALVLKARDLGLLSTSGAAPAQQQQPQPGRPQGQRNQPAPQAPGQTPRPGATPAPRATPATRPRAGATNTTNQ
jgi:cell division protein FtsI/penicillin-binding protein 2